MDQKLEAELRQLHDRVCKAIADPKRLLMINLLRHGELSVGEISASLGVSQSNASQHLALLRDRGIVVPRRQGTTIHYRLGNPKILEAIDLMREFVAEETAGRGAAATTDTQTGRVSGVFLG